VYPQNALPLSVQDGNTQMGVIMNVCHRIAIQVYIVSLAKEGSIVGWISFSWIMPTKIKVGVTFHVPVTWNSSKIWIADSASERACYVCRLCHYLTEPIDLSKDFAKANDLSAPMRDRVSELESDWKTWSFKQNRPARLPAEAPERKKQLDDALKCNANN